MDPVIRRSEGTLALSDRGERYRYAWLPESPTRAMILVHGFAEHAGRYDAMAMHFAGRGFAVHAYDQAGHGRTRGPRGHVDRFERLLDELARFVERIRGEHPGLPVVLVGHSMGGLVTAATTIFRAPEVDRVVLSGPLLGLESGAGLSRRLRLLVAHMLSRVAPRAGLSTGLDAAGLSRDPEVVRRYLEDPYVKDRMSARFAAGLSTMLEQVALCAARFDRPLLLLHGREDPLCPVAASERFFAGLAPETAKQSRMTIYPGLRHEIFNEPERLSVFHDLETWLDGHVSESGS